MRNAASVLPDPVGAEISTGLSARITGQPCSCGSVGVEKRRTNHSCTSGWAHLRLSGTKRSGRFSGTGVTGDNIRLFYRESSFLLRPLVLQAFRRDSTSRQPV